jgi:hypothetical protein
MRVVCRVKAAAVAARAIALVGLTAPPAYAFDTTPPEVDLERGLIFKVGSTLSDSTDYPTIPAVVTWTASDNVGIAGQTGYFRTESDEYRPSPLPSTRRWTIPKVHATVPTRSDTEVVLTAFDERGNQSTIVTPFNTRLIGQGAMMPSAGWSVDSCDCWSGGEVYKSTQAGASLRASFYGHSVAVIGNRATDRGSMQVYINGKLQKTVDTAGPPRTES